jgi:hydroxymethylbilane synthase
MTAHVPTSTGRRAVRLGTRASALARAQSGLVADALSGSTGGPVELVEITTAGDRSTRAVAELGGTGVFVSALRDALLAGDIDLAVHSYKDLPTAPAPGLVLAAVPAREDPRDVLVARDGARLDDLPAGARIGTGAPRRMAQLRAYRRDLDVVPVRGNVDTRVGKVADGTLDAVVLARAGLARLGRMDAVTEVLDPDRLLPAPAQGALAIECRADDTALRSALAALEHPEARATVTAERALLAALEAGCSAPVGALAILDAAEAADPVRPRTALVLRGIVAAIDGSAVVRLSTTGTITDAEEVGRRLAADLLAAGVSNLLGSSR